VRPLADRDLLLLRHGFGVDDRYGVPRNARHEKRGCRRA
jgi:hypothetical protein